MEKQLAKFGHVDGCKSMADIYERYHKLDLLYEETARIGRLKMQSELNFLNISECGGITLHIDIDGELVFSKICQHRMAIAFALELPEVPFALGAVYSQVAKSFETIRNRYSPKFISEYINNS